MTLHLVVLKFPTLINLQIRVQVADDGVETDDVTALLTFLGFSVKVRTGSLVLNGNNALAGLFVKFNHKYQCVYKS